MENVKQKKWETEELIREIKKLDTEGKIAAAAFAKGVRFALEITGGPEPEQKTA
ncbi:MAG: hypothetical protein RR296_11755 [Clostridia bacterium]